MQTPFGSAGQQEPQEPGFGMLHLLFAGNRVVLPCREGARVAVEHLLGHVKTNIQLLSLSPVHFSNTATPLGLIPQMTKLSQITNLGEHW